MDLLIREIHKLKKDLFNMRFKKINGQIQSPAEFNKINATKNYIISALQLKADIGELSLKDLYI